jgi:hypothetical protein
MTKGQRKNVDKGMKSDFHPVQFFGPLAESLGLTKQPYFMQMIFHTFVFNK